MPNFRKSGFSVYVIRGGLRLNLIRGIVGLAEAFETAKALARARPVGVGGMVIRCESTQRQWLVAELVDAPPVAGDLRSVS